MRAGGRDIVPTHSALFELAEERRSLQEGHDFLDQKRVLLAGEILRRLRACEALERDLAVALAAARAALASAVAVHGVSALGAVPAPVPAADAVEVVPEAFLGLALVTLRLRAAPATPVREPVDPSPDARRTKARFERVVAILVELAGMRASLQRLIADYRRTERRTRALEDVILPEIGVALHATEADLEEQDLEEAVRVRIGR